MNQKSELKALAESIASLVLRLDDLIESIPSPVAAAPASIDWGGLIDSIIAANAPTRAMLGWKSEGVETGVDGAKAMLVGIRNFYEVHGQISEKQTAIVKMCCPPHLRAW